MWDTLRALLGRKHCPWCLPPKDQETWFEKAYETWPLWAVKLDFRYNKLWRPGQRWHLKHHNAGKE